MPSTSTTRATALLLAALLLALVAGGCGGDDAPAEADVDSYEPRAVTTVDVAEPRLTKAQFVTEVNALCRRAWDKVLDNWRQHIDWQEEGMSDEERFEDALRVSLMPGIDVHIFDQIRQLGAPAGETGAVEEIIIPFQAAVELGWEGRWRARTPAEIVPRFETYNRLARAYGLTDCLVNEAHLQLAPIDS